MWFLVVLMVKGDEIITLFIIHLCMPVWELKIRFNVKKMGNFSFSVTSLEYF